MTDQPVLLDVTNEGVAYVTINSPATRNAFDGDIVAALAEAFETLHGADGVRIVFLRGAGGNFSAGANLNWMANAIELTENDNRLDALDMARMLKLLWDVPALTVALVEGGAYGGGAGLVAACDMAFATPKTKFAFSEARLGLIPGVISPYVVRAIGARTARALFASAEVFGAEHAARIGLLTSVADDLTVVAEKLAGDIMACGPNAIADSKRLVDAVEGRVIDDALMEETAHRIARARVSEEGQEGVRAFLAKRKPSWAG